MCTKATDRAETCEVLEERLHEVEAEVKLNCVDIFRTLRSDSRAGFISHTQRLIFDGFLVLRVSCSGEEMDHERLLLWPPVRISERGGARSHWWVRSPVGDVSEEDMSGTDRSGCWPVWILASAVRVPSSSHELRAAGLDGRGS